MLSPKFALVTARRGSPSKQYLTALRRMSATDQGRARAGSLQELLPFQRIKKYSYMLNEDAGNVHTMYLGESSDSTVPTLTNKSHQVG